MAVVTFAPTVHDSRVRRIVRLLASAEHEVALLSADRERPADLPLAAHFVLPAAGARRADLVRQIALALPARFMPAAAPRLHGLLPSSRQARRALAAFCPDVIHANDWSTLPVAAEAAMLSGARLIYDSHEVAVDEHAHLAWWRWLVQPHVAAVEARLIGRADRVTVVSDGVAASLAARYGSAIRLPEVIRNIPETLREPVSGEATAGDPPEMVYAGLLLGERRIDAMIGALALTARPWRFRIIGFGQPSLIAALKRQAVAAGVAERIVWQDAVPPERLVEALSGSDVGLFLSDGTRPQQQAALPNKVFEYAAAGLGLIASGSAEVDRLIGDHLHGCFLDTASPAALATALDAADATTIVAWKRKALGFARAATWGAEGARLLAIYDSVCDPAGVRGA